MPSTDVKQVGLNKCSEVERLSQNIRNWRTEWNQSNDSWPRKIFSLFFAKEFRIILAVFKYSLANLSLCRYMYVYNNQGYCIFFTPPKYRVVKTHISFPPSLPCLSSYYVAVKGLSSVFPRVVCPVFFRLYPSVYIDVMSVCCSRLLLLDVHCWPNCVFSFTVTENQQNVFTHLMHTVTQGMFTIFFLN